MIQGTQRRRVPTCDAKRVTESKQRHSIIVNWKHNSIAEYSAQRKDGEFYHKATVSVLIGDSYLPVNAITSRRMGRIEDFDV
jgi:hypothetical protein